MNYPESIDKILKSELTHLIDTVRKKEGAFKPGTVEHYCDMYRKMKKNQKTFFFFFARFYCEF